MAAPNDKEAAQNDYHQALVDAFLDTLARIALNVARRNIAQRRNNGGDPDPQAGK